MASYKKIPAYGNDETVEATEYTDSWKPALDDAAQKLLNREAFEYDYEKDPLYQQYAKSYTKNGKRAMEDTLGQISARTGGLASSYAASAATQQNNNYMQQLADKIPELRDMAYRMYTDEDNRLQQQISLMRGLQGDEYGRYRDAVSDDRYADNLAYDREWQKKQWDYNTMRDEIEDARYDDNLAYDREWQKKQWDYNTKRDEIEDARYDAQRKAETTGGKEETKYLGYPSAFETVVNQAKDYVDNKSYYRGGDRLYYAILNSGANLTESQVRAMCNEAGFAYDLMDFCIGNGMTPTEFNKRAVG